MPDLKPFLITGIALGGAMGTLISWTLVNQEGVPTWAALLVAVAFGGLASLAYGLLAGPPLADRDALVKARMGIARQLADGFRLGRARRRRRPAPSFLDQTHPSEYVR